MDARPSHSIESAGDDRKALLAARDGGHDAGRWLMSRHGPSMVRTAWRVLGRFGGNEADDVVQEAFIAALTTSALPTGDVGSWLRSITVRKALDGLRRSRRRAESSLPDPSETGPEPLDPADPESAIAVLTLRKGLAQLSASDRAVLTLVDLEGHSMADAAGTLGITRVAIKLRAVRARRKLARILKPQSGRRER